MPHTALPPSGVVARCQGQYPVPGTRYPVPGVQRSYHAGSWIEAPYPIGAHGEKDFAGVGGNRQIRDHAAGRDKRHFTRSLLDGANAAAIMANINSAPIG